MRLGIVVTEFPKTTETFILRDVMQFAREGHEIRLYHMSRYRKHDKVHDFARPILGWARSFGFLFDRRVLGATGRALLRKPLTIIRIKWDLLRGFWSHPVTLAKSLILIPKCLAVAEDLTAWGADHLHGEFASHPATCCWIVGRLTGLPYSVSCRAHDIFITQAMLDRKLGEAAFIRTITNYNVTFLRDRVPSLADRTMHVIHSSLDPEQVPALDPTPPGPFQVLYVGSLEVRKGIEFLFQALHAVNGELGDWRCRLVGRGPHEKTLRELVRTRGLQDRVEFLGPQPHEEVGRRYAQAHVVVTPSIIGPGGRTEGIPNVVIETLAHQRPVITTRVSGIPELVEHGVTGFLVEPEDSAAIADCLLRVQAEPDAAHAMARRGRQRVVKEFNVVINAHRQLELFAAHTAKNLSAGSRTP